MSHARVTAERSLRKMQEVPADSEVVVMDVSHVTQVNAMGRRMLLEGLRRLGLDGHPVVLVDPKVVLPEPTQDDVEVEVVEELELG